MILQFRIVSLDAQGVCRVEGLYDDRASADRALASYEACFPLCRFLVVPNR